MSWACPVPPGLPCHLQLDVCVCRCGHQWHADPCRSAWPVWEVHTCSLLPFPSKDRATRPRTSEILGSTLASCPRPAPTISSPTPTGLVEVLLGSPLGVPVTLLTDAGLDHRAVLRASVVRSCVPFLPSREPPRTPRYMFANGD